MSIDAAPAPRSRAGLVWIVLLAVALAGSVAAAAILCVEVQRLHGGIEEVERRLDEQQRLIDEQREQLDVKERFGEAMGEVMSAARALDGAPVGDLVDLGAIEAIAIDAWRSREDAPAVQALADEVLERAAALRALADAAAAQLGSNASGSIGESLVDELGAGHVRVEFGSPAGLCGGEPIGCVSSDDPRRILLDPAEFDAEYMDDDLRRLVAAHEFAHVLQFTSPGPTAAAASTFGDDWEYMADCYALTLTDGWSLERRVWRDSTSYWDVSVGYGRVCDEAGRAVIRDWLGEVGFRYRPVSQEAA